jgi:hypothetical protein
MNDGPWIPVRIASVANARSHPTGDPDILGWMKIVGAVIRVQLLERSFAEECRKQVRPLTGCESEHFWRVHPDDCGVFGQDTKRVIVCEHMIEAD